MVPNNIEKYSPEYNEKKLITKIKKYGKQIGEGCIKQICYLWYVMTEKSTPTSVKMQIAGALGYLILPIDLIPDFIPVVGFTDDIAAIVYVYNSVKKYITPEIEEKATKKVREFF